MRQRNLICSIVLLGITLATFLEISSIPIGTARKPEMGFYPLILASLLMILSFSLLWETLKEKKEKGSPDRRGWGGLKKVGLTLGTLLGFAFFLKPLGYIPSMFLLIAFLMRAIEPQRWWKVIMVALLCSVVSFLILALVLDTPLPQGILGI
jgi:tripartite tricarboxylate transporter TctB family protein